MAPQKGDRIGKQPILNGGIEFPMPPAGNHMQFRGNPGAVERCLQHGRGCERNYRIGIAMNDEGGGWPSRTSVIGDMRAAIAAP